MKSGDFDTSNDAPEVVVPLDVVHPVHAGTLTRRATLADYPRLAAQCAATGGTVAFVWRLQCGRRRLNNGETHPALHVRLDAVVPLICQRCLAATEVPIGIDRRWIFLPDENAAAICDTQEEDDVLALPPLLDAPTLNRLLEDEILLSLPFAPMHAQCPPSPEIDALHRKAQKENPFAVLRTLQR